jgi:hypothetical protein
MKIKSALMGAALAGSMFAAGAAQATVVYQSVPDLTVAPGPAWCSQCGSDGQNVGQYFTLGASATVNTLTFVTTNWYNWPTSVTVSLFQDGGANTIGASLYQNTFSSFASDVLSGNGTDIVTVKLGTMLLAAGSYDLFIYSPGSFTFDGLPGGPGNQIIQFVAAGVGPSVGDGYYFIGANTDSGISIGLSVPETSSWVMMLAGFAGLGFLGYRRNKATALSA